MTAPAATHGRPSTRAMPDPAKPAARRGRTTPPTDTCRAVKRRLPRPAAAIPQGPQPKASKRTAESADGRSASAGRSPEPERAAESKTPSHRRAVAFTAAAAQSVAFTSAALLLFLCTDIAAEFTASSASRWWPLGAFAIAMTVAANATRRTGDLGRARYTGALALGGLTLASLALAIAPTFWFATAAAGATGATAGLVVAIAGRVLATVEYGDGSASVTLSAAALLTGIVAGTGALFLLPLYGWRGVFGLVVVAGVLAGWKFAELVPIRAQRKRTDT